MATGAIDLVAFVDGHLWRFPGELLNLEPFFCAEFARAGAESFDGGQRFSLPKNFYLELDVVLHHLLSWYVAWDEASEMAGERVGLFVV